jgi:exodeoxyribonuclease VII large subunit
MRALDPRSPPIPMSTAPPSPDSPPLTLSVSDFNRCVRTAIEQQWPCLWIRGEISNLVRAASGHCYFSLKDANAQVRCVLFRHRAALLPFRLDNGQQVEIKAQASLYEPRGEFQLTTDTVRRAGQGALYEAFLRLRAQLEAEGLFDPSRKRPLPDRPRCIGLITSPSGAALHDVLTTLSQRAAHIDVIVYPTLVQGADAPAGISAAVAIANQHAQCDLLLLVRGGGSLEDLQAFNDARVAYAIASSVLPIICGVGHETDVTIADLVADQRAATPTAAAQWASAGWLSAQDQSRHCAQALQRAILRILERHMQALDLWAHRLIHPKNALERQRARLVPLVHRLAHGRITTLSRARDKLARLDAALKALNPGAILSRGFCLAHDAQGRLLRDASSLSPGDTVRLRWARGAADTVVKTLIPD